MRNFMLVVRLIGYMLLLLPINEKAGSVDPLLFPRWQENGPARKKACWKGIACSCSRLYCLGAV